MDDFGKVLPDVLPQMDAIQGTCAAKRQEKCERLPSAARQAVKFYDFLADLIVIW
jgi:hypothetical protein